MPRQRSLARLPRDPAGWLRGRAAPAAPGARGDRAVHRARLAQRDQRPADPRPVGTALARHRLLRPRHPQPRAARRRVGDPAAAARGLRRDGGGHAGRPGLRLPRRQGRRGGHLGHQHRAGDPVVPAPCWSWSRRSAAAERWWSPRSRWSTRPTSPGSSGRRRRPSRPREFVLAARARGETLGWILFREITPNIGPTLLVEIALRLTYAIMFIASLSFLGLGVQPPSANWGVMVGAEPGAAAGLPGRRARARAADRRAGDRRQPHRRRADPVLRRPHPRTADGMTTTQTARRDGDLAARGLSVGYRSRDRPDPGARRRLRAAPLRTDPRPGRRVRLRQEHARALAAGLPGRRAGDVGRPGRVRRPRPRPGVHQGAAQGVGRAARLPAAGHRDLAQPGADHPPPLRRRAAPAPRPRHRGGAARAAREWLGPGGDPRAGDRAAQVPAPVQRRAAAADRARAGALLSSPRC